MSKKKFPRYSDAFRENKDYTRLGMAKEQKKLTEMEEHK